MKKLAIIIPAYKANFLKETLDSLKNQTNKNFKVYVGDDNSPFNLKEIVDQYLSSLDLSYVKFENNLGSLSLIQQWERVIDLSDEEWIWLFSDDDIVSETAVENFYRVSTVFENDKLFKFHTKMINDKGDLISLYFDKTNIEKSIISPQKFISDRLTFNRFRSYAVEYVFHRDIYKRYKFVEFPLAWYSDDATWLQFSHANNGIRIINDFVFWRFSGENISSNNSDNKTISKKLQATKSYLEWLYYFKIDKDLDVKNKNLLFTAFMQLSNLKQSKKSSDFKNFVLDFSIAFNEKDMNAVIRKVKYIGYKASFLALVKKMLKRR